MFSRFFKIVLVLFLGLAPSNLSANLSVPDFSAPTHKPGHSVAFPYQDSNICLFKYQYCAPFLDDLAIKMLKYGHGSCKRDHY